MGIAYTKSGGANIAFRVVGDGPVDLVMVPGFISHLEIAWEEPLLASFLSRLSSFCRVIQFDKRGTGLSDRLPGDATATLDERIEDILAVMDAAGSERAALFAWSEGGPTSLVFAATHPERTAALVLVGTTAKFAAAPDYPCGIDPHYMELWIEAAEEAWGTGVGLWLFAPSLVDDEKFATWWARYQRFAASPGSVAASQRMHLDLDARPMLAKIEAPALIMHRVDDMLVPIGCARYMAEHLADARLVEIPGADHMFWVGHAERALDEVRRLLSDTPEGADLRERPRAHRRPGSGWEALTDAEAEVAYLVAEGLSNPEIARRLVVSRHTVESHLKRVYAKLGISSRLELARRGGPSRMP